MDLPAVKMQSKGYTWAALSTLDIDLNALFAPARSFKAPVCTMLKIGFSGTTNTGSAGLPARMQTQIIDQIYIADIAGKRVDLSGSDARVVAMMELGRGWSDAWLTNTIAASQTGATLKFVLPIVVRPQKCKRRGDFGFNVKEFFDGGEMKIVTHAALLATNYGTTQGGTFTVYAEVVDELVPEAKSRLCFFSLPIINPEDNYKTNNAWIRSVDFYNGPVNDRGATTPTAWSSQNFQSNNLDIGINRPDYLYQHDYLEDSTPSGVRDGGSVATASLVYNEDVHVTGQSIPLVQPKRGQSTASMKKLDLVHIRSDISSITTSDLPRVIFSTITERSPALDAAIGLAGKTKAVVAADGNDFHADRAGRVANALPRRAG